jgi:ABC-2 type transport system permease protein
MLSSSSLIRAVIQKEVREVVRDGRLRVLGAIVLILAIAALAFGVQQATRAEHAREHARDRASSQWKGQGEKNPHVAAHYGTHVFAPTSAATAIDPGVSAFMGRTVKMEAHRRNLSSHSAAQDSGGLQRMGAFSVASVLLQLVPLLIIALGYGLWSLERERGTLRQVISSGVDRKILLWGKGTALALLVGTLLAPAALVVAGVLWWLGGGDSGTLARFGMLAVAYSVYFTVYGGLTLYTSATVRASRGALVALVGAWALFSLVTPRVATEVAAIVAPLPSEAEWARGVKRSLEAGLDGGTTREDAVEAFTSDLMAAQGLEDTGMMVDASFIAGFELQAEAKWEDSIYDHHMRALEDQIALQEAWVGRLSLLSPYVAMRTLSAGLCGTDYAHHRHFTDHAETWRKGMVDQLNEAFADNAGAAGWEYRAGPELWKKVRPFEYTSPGPSLALDTHWVSVLSLLLWCALGLALAFRSARRMEVV